MGKVLHFGCARDTAAGALTMVHSDDVQNVPIAHGLSRGHQKSQPSLGFLCK